MLSVSKKQSRILTESVLRITKLFLLMVLLVNYSELINSEFEKEDMVMGIENIPPRDRETNCFKCNHFNSRRMYCNCYKFKVRSTSLDKCDGFLSRRKVMKKTKDRLYAVRVGRVPGVYHS